MRINMVFDRVTHYEQALIKIRRFSMRNGRLCF